MEDFESTASILLDKLDELSRNILKYKDSLDDGNNHYTQSIKSKVESIDNNLRSLFFNIDKINYKYNSVPCIHDPNKAPSVNKVSEVPVNKTSLVINTQQSPVNKAPPVVTIPEVPVNKSLPVVTIPEVPVNKTSLMVGTRKSSPAINVERPVIEKTSPKNNTIIIGKVNLLASNVFTPQFNRVPMLPKKSSPPRVILSEEPVPPPFDDDLPKLSSPLSVSNSDCGSPPPITSLPVIRIESTPRLRVSTATATANDEVELSDTESSSTNKTYSHVRFDELIPGCDIYTLRDNEYKFVGTLLSRYSEVKTIKVSGLNYKLNYETDNVYIDLGNLTRVKEKRRKYLNAKQKIYEARRKERDLVKKQWIMGNESSSCNDIYGSNSIDEQVEILPEDD